MGLEGGPGAIIEGHVGRWVNIHRLLSRGRTWSKLESELMSMQSECVGLIPNEVSDFRPGYKRGKRGKKSRGPGGKPGERPNQRCIHYSLGPYSLLWPSPHSFLMALCGNLLSIMIPATLDQCPPT